MKTKSLIMVTLMGTVVMFNRPTFACTGGTEVSIVNGATSVYCISNNTMNWWTAFSWCQAQNYHLATWAEVCPNTGVSIVSSGSTGLGCSNRPNYTGKNLWVSQPYDSDNAYKFYLTTPDTILSGISTRTSTNARALCKM